MCHLILVDHLLFFHFLNCYYFIRFSIAANSYFSKSTSTDDFSGDEVANRDFSSLQTIIFGFFMKYFLFYQFFFLLRELHLIHLFRKFIPSFLSFSFFVFCLSILIFNICFSTCCLLFCTITCRWSLLCGCWFLLLHAFCRWSIWQIKL